MYNGKVTLLSCEIELLK